MSKVLPASCDATSKVIYDSLVVQSAEILSEGTKPSEGILILDKGQAYYLTSSASDIKDLIISLGSILDKIIAISTGIDAASNSPGGQTSAISELSALKSQLLSTKDTLK